MAYNILEYKLYLSVKFRENIFNRLEVTEVQTNELGTQFNNI